jgi:hypothetical protein
LSSVLAMFVHHLPLFGDARPCMGNNIFHSK